MVEEPPDTIAGEPADEWAGRVGVMKKKDNSARLGKGFPLGWEIVIDVAAAVGFGLLLNVAGIHPLITWGTPVLFLLVAIPLAFKRRRSAAG